MSFGEVTPTRQSPHLLAPDTRLTETPLWTCTKGCASLHGEEKFMTSRPARILLSVLFVASLGGCATTGRVDALEQRLNDVSRKADDAAAAAANAQKTANSAASRADAAEAQAKAAAQRADDAARTAEAIFKKRVSK
jgi:hypothetical protein